MNDYASHLLDLRRRQDLLGILLFSLITILIWVAFTLITARAQPQIDTQLRQLSKPLTPSLAVEVFSTLEKRSHFSEAELNTFAILTLYKGNNSRPEIVTIEEAQRRARLQNQELVDQSLLKQLVLPTPEATSPSPTTTTSPVNTTNGEAVNPTTNNTELLSTPTTN